MNSRKIMNKKPLRILLADDHALFRKGIAALLSSRPDVVIVGEAGDGEQAVALAQRTMPDLIFMDIGLPLISGLEAIRIIKKQLPGIQIIVLTISDNDQDLITAIKNGAQGYLLKNMEPAQLFEILDITQRGEVLLPLAALETIRASGHGIAEQGVQPPKRIPGLTPRESEILDLVARGKTNKEIAAGLSITESTVKLHLHNILGKTHMQNRIQLAIFAVGQGLGGDILPTT
jgi:two-component system, NarL family, nitrate/nitrite response regulator NarL